MDVETFVEAVNAVFAEEETLVLLFFKLDWTFMEVDTLDDEDEGLTSVFNFLDSVVSTVDDDVVVDTDGTTGNDFVIELFRDEVGTRE